MKLPQVSLRDLFWLVIVCGLAVGWVTEGSGLASVLILLAASAFWLFVGFTLGAVANDSWGTTRKED
jgi:hypothetical protein